MMCTQCEKIIPKADSAVSYTHLRHFYYRYSDDLLSHNYYFCPQCELIWCEDDCDYPADAGYFWTACTIVEFINSESDTLPDEVQKTPSGIKTWLESFNGYFSVELFRRLYRK